MTDLAPMPRPDGKPAADRWFTNAATGHVWRVRVQWQAAQAALAVVLDGDDPAEPAPPPSQITVSCSVAWCKPDGAVQRDADGAAMLFPSAGRTFTSLDFEADGFNADDAIAGMITGRIAAAESQLIGKGRLVDAIERWERDEAAGPDRVRIPTAAVALDRVTNATPSLGAPPARAPREVVLVPAAPPAPEEASSKEEGGSR